MTFQFRDGDRHWLLVKGWRLLFSPPSPLTHFLAANVSPQVLQGESRCLISLLVIVSAALATLALAGDFCGFRSWTPPDPLPVRRCEPVSDLVCRSVISTPRIDVAVCRCRLLTHFCRCRLLMPFADGPGKSPRFLKPGVLPQYGELKLSHLRCLGLIMGRRLPP